MNIQTDADRNLTAAINAVVLLGRIDSTPRQGGGGRHVSPLDPAVLSPKSQRFAFLLLGGGECYSSKQE